MNYDNRSSSGIGIMGVILIVNIVLKLAGLVNWSWNFVLWPLWISLILVFIVVIILVIIYLWYRR